MKQQQQPVDMRQLARVGAGIRYREVVDEITALRKAFPELETGTLDKEERLTVFANGVEHPRVGTPKSKVKRRRGMSKAARRAVSQRMTRYWKTRRSDAKKNFKTKADKR